MNPLEMKNWPDDIPYDPKLGGGNQLSEVWLPDGSRPYTVAELDQQLKTVAAETGRGKEVVRDLLQ